MSDFSELRGSMLCSVRTSDGSRMEFELVDGTVYSLEHEQSCMESVSIYEICGDLGDLVGSTILVAEVSRSEESRPRWLQEWTFYKLRTVRGSVTIRWYGESNGHYSVAVDFVKLRGSDAESKEEFLMSAMNLGKPYLVH